MSEKDPVGPGRAPAATPEAGDGADRGGQPRPSNAALAADTAGGAKQRDAGSHPTGETTEFYAEPATLSGRDTAGVVVALIALLLIGIGGYIWLTPGMSVAKMLGRPV